MSKSPGFRIDKLQPYLLGAVAQSVLQQRRAGKEVIDLSRVNPDLGPDSAVIDKLVQSVLRPHNHRYSASSGIRVLREAFCERYQSDFGVSLDAETQALVTLGTKEGIAHLLSAMVSREDSVIVPSPAYPIHSAGIFLSGARTVGVPLYATSEEANDSDFILDGSSDGFFERLQLRYQEIWPAPKVLLLSFPHNPTTSTVTIEFFERVVQFAREHNMYVIHDFAYADLCFENYKAPSILQVKGAEDVAVEFSSLSKGLNLAGWRVGFCAGNKDMVTALARIKSYLDFGVFQPLQLAAVEALSRRAQIIEEVVDVYQARRDVLVSGLKAKGWDVHCPRSTMFVWARIPEGLREIGSQQFSSQLLEGSGVAVSPGAGFDLESDDYVRLAAVENEQQLRKAVDEIGRYMERA